MGWREKALARLDKATTQYIESTDPAERKEGGKRVRDAFEDIIRETQRLEMSLVKTKALSGVYEEELLRGLAYVNRLAILLASSRGNDPENRFALEGGVEPGRWARKIQRLFDLSEFSTFGDVNWDTTYPLRRPVWKRWLQVLGERLVRVGFGRRPNVK